MNAHHKKASYRHTIPRTVSHFSCDSFTLPLLPETHEQPPRAAAVEGAKEGKPRAAPRLFKAVDRVPFGWQVDAIVPTRKGQHSDLPVELEQLITQAGDYYYCPTVNLADLLQPVFLNSFLRQGSLTAISLNAEEGEDVVCIDGRGRLVLSVSKDTYEVLGLPGRASAHGSHRQRFIIEISLTDPAFRGGKPGLERVRSLLRNWPRSTNLWAEIAGVAQPSDGHEGGKTFDMLFSFVNAEGKLAPMEFPHPLTARLCQPILRRHSLSSINLPRDVFGGMVSANGSDGPSRSHKRQRTSSGALCASVKDWELRSQELREWLGLITVGAEDQLRFGRDEEDRQWGVEEDCEEGEVVHLSWTGFFHPRVWSGILDRLLDSSSASAASQSPFISLSLTPIAHSPLSHLSAASPPVVGTNKKPNGRKVKRGRGRGEEEEAGESERGWELLWSQVGKGVRWCCWEGH